MVNRTQVNAREIEPYFINIIKLSLCRPGQALRDPGG
jgi:hypothetical protein